MHMTLGLVTATVLAGAAVAVGGTPASATEDGLTLVAVRGSLLTTHYWYRQTYQGHPVLGGVYARHGERGPGAAAVTDGRPGGGAPRPTPRGVPQRAARA